MSKGHVFLAQNSNIDYVTQAYALALTIKKKNKINQTCLITNDEVPAGYIHVFDHIVSIPWKDSASKSQWKIENRWKIIHATPFKENIVYDTDMLLLSSNDHWWDFLQHKEVALTSKVFDYKGRTITSDYYRKIFTKNSLPNVYFGIHYFKKKRPAFEFYHWLQFITENYKKVYSEFLPNEQQKFCSMDVNAALALKFMDAVEDFETKSLAPSFIHMKPGVQGWSKIPGRWVDAVGTTFYDGKLTVGNYIQTGVFHYTDDDFLTQELIEQLKYV